jgi:hypothetical protein
MRNVYIIHGWDGSPDEPMLQWLKSSLERRGFSVSVPVMPDTEAPEINAWVNKIRDTVILEEDTILIGHSIGCQAILRYLETVDEGIKIAGVVLIAPWMKLDEKTLKEEGEEVIRMTEPWMNNPINFNKVKRHIIKAVAIFSDNDPYVSLEQKDVFEDKLGAEIIIEHGKGHFDPDSNVRESPSILNAVLSL